MMLMTKMPALARMAVNLKTRELEEEEVHEDGQAEQEDQVEEDLSAFLGPLVSVGQETNEEF